MPARIEIGPRDLKERRATVARRDRPAAGARFALALEETAAKMPGLLAEVQQSLFAQAREAMRRNTFEPKDYAELSRRMAGEGAGLASLFWCGAESCETKVRDETRATCRAVPLGQDEPGGRCLVCGEPARERAYFAKAY